MGDCVVKSIAKLMPSRGKVLFSTAKREPQHRFSLQLIAYRKGGQTGSAE